MAMPHKLIKTVIRNHTLIGKIREKNVLTARGKAINPKGVTFSILTSDQNGGRMQSRRRAAEIGMRRRERRKKGDQNQRRGSVLGSNTALMHPSGSSLNRAQTKPAQKTASSLAGQTGAGQVQIKCSNYSSSYLCSSPIKIKFRVLVVLYLTLRISI
jgi:hypothetical protein